LFGVPHPDFGEGVMAAVKPDGVTPLDVEQLSAKLAQTLNKYKQPKKFIVMDEFPRNQIGKVLKKELRETYFNTFQ